MARLVAGAAVALSCSTGGNLTPAAATPINSKQFTYHQWHIHFSMGIVGLNNTEVCFLIETALFCVHFTTTFHKNVIIQWGFLPRLV